MTAAGSGLLDSGGHFHRPLLEAFRLAAQRLSRNPAGGYFSLKDGTGGSQRLLIAGGSCWSDAGCAALARFAQANTLPVLTSFRRQDLIDNDARCYAGHLSLGLSPHLQQRVKAADLIIALGTRLGDINTMTYSLLRPPRLAA